MREIKFRAYIPTLNKVCFKGKGLTLDEIRRLDEGYFRDDVVWVEYTGLKDKKGKEIYEGDILEIQVGSYETNFVEFYNGNYYLEKHGLTLSDWNERGEVIGNIYENPNPLES